MAPYSHDISDLSPRNRAIFLAGVRGADGEEPTDPNAPAAPEAPSAEVPADGAPVAADDAATPVEAAQDPLALVPALPEDLAAPAVEDLYALAQQIESVRDELRSQSGREAIVAVREATDRRNAVAAEITRRIDQDRQDREEMEALNAELANEAPLPAPELSMASATPTPPTAAQLASARGPQPTAAQSPTPPQPARPRVALLAGAADRTGGDEISLDVVGESLDRAKNNEARTIVASLPPFTETAGLDVEVLGSGSTEHNSRLMRETREAWDAVRRAQRHGETPDPMLAAICEPLNTSEPVRGIFPSRAASRLGFQFFQSVGLAALDTSVALWDETDQASVAAETASTWKPCLLVDCPDPVTIKAEAVVACLLWDNTQEMSNPENIANLLNALAALRARTKEGRILHRIDQLSHRYTHEGDYGAVPTLIEALNSAMARAVFANREDENTYTAIIPPGAVHLLGIDLASRGFEAQTVNDVFGYVRDRVPGLGEVVMSLDASLGTASFTEPSLPFDALTAVGDTTPDALPRLDGTYRIRLVEPGAAIYSETGALNVGTSTDSTLLRMNRTQYFAEEYLFLAKQGPAPWFSLDVELCGNGARAGWVTPFDCNIS
jgi:hypothetical protein